MKVYESKDLRNLGLFGHAGSGKTSFAEALLLEAGAITRRGTVEEKSTVSDHNEIEQERGSSVNATPLFAEWNNIKINIIDTPGYNDFVGEVISAARVVDTAAILVNGQNSLEVGSENGWHYAEKNNIPAMFIINKLDFEQAKFEQCTQDIIDRWGRSAVVVQYPVQTGPGFNAVIDVYSQAMYQYPAGGGHGERKDIPDSEKANAEKFRNELIEAVAESDEELMTKFFDEGTLTDDELQVGFKKALTNRQIFPIIGASSKNNIGVDQFLQFVLKIMPSPADMASHTEYNGKELKFDAVGQNSVFIFKMMSEAHLGDLTFFKVMTGKVSAGLDLINSNRGSAERLNQIFIVNGKKRVEVPTLVAGDIGATVKLKQTQISDTLHDKGFDVAYPRLQFPNPIIRTAVVPKTKGEEEKIGMGLHALEIEDPALKLEHSQELRQTILYGQGELHLAVAKQRLERRFKVESEFVEPRVPYRETIQKQVRGMYRHKKQTGGAGQFAEVHMIMEPYREGMGNPDGIQVRGRDLIELDWGGKLEYLNCIVGGVIDQRFLPAILKGVMDKMTNGPLTGCYVRDIRIAIFDGKMHPVDSNEAAFKTAGMMVFKENFIKADPKLLEPVYDIAIRIPEDCVGDVMSDLPTRRGVILGIDTEGRYQVIKARMPLAELDKYSTALRSMSAGRATYTQEFAEYQVVPANVQMKLMDEHKKREDEE